MNVAKEFCCLQLQALKADREVMCSCRFVLLPL